MQAFGGSSEIQRFGQDHETALIFVGWFARRVGVLGSHATMELNRLASNIASVLTISGYLALVG